MTDHYKTLGVSEKSSDSDIKTAWKKLAKEHHPDKHNGDDTKMKEINASYDAIKTAEKRAENNMGQGGFDGFRRPQGRQTPHGFEFNFGGGGFNMDDILRQGGMRGGFRQQQQPQNQDINLEHVVTLEETFNGKRVDASFALPNGELRTLIVDIPKGTEHGDRIRFMGQGQTEIKNIKPGNLYVHIKVRQHPRFERHGHMLLQKISVDAVDAIVGTNVQIKTIDSSTVSLKIPEGTKNGDQLRLRGKGFVMKGIEGRGDLIVIVEITIAKALTSEEESLFRQIQAIRNKR